MFGKNVPGFKVLTEQEFNQVPQVIVMMAEMSLNKTIQEAAKEFNITNDDQLMDFIEQVLAGNGFTKTNIACTGCKRDKWSHPDFQGAPMCGSTAILLLAVSVAAAVQKDGAAAGPKLELVPSNKVAETPKKPTGDDSGGPTFH